MTCNVCATAYLLAWLIAEAPAAPVQLEQAVSESDVIARTSSANVTARYKLIRGTSQTVSKGLVFWINAKTQEVVMKFLRSGRADGPDHCGSPASRQLQSTARPVNVGEYSAGWEFASNRSTLPAASLRTHSRQSHVFEKEMNHERP